MRHSETGFTYIWALAAVTLLSIGLAQVGPVWEHEKRRERERELVRIGGIYAQAIASYYRASPGSLKQYPASLQDLLQDPRHLGIRRHLRRLYTDPMQPGVPLAVIRGSDGSVRGVYSTDSAIPLRRDTVQVIGSINLPAQARSYADWRFTPELE